LTYAYGYDLDYTNSLYDRKGQRVSMTATVPAQSLSNHLFKYEYDSLYQLKKWMPQEVKEEPSQGGEKSHTDRGYPLGGRGVSGVGLINTQR
jgi:hypothetical protein